MTDERREEVVLIALVVSAAVHAALMLFARPQVMTRPVPVARKERSVPMRVVQNASQPDPVRLEQILDLEAVKDAPPVAGDASVPRAEAPGATKATARVPEPETTELAAPDLTPAVFEARLSDRTVAAPVPIVRMETPELPGADPSAPDFAVALPRTDAPPASLPVAMPSVRAPAPDLPPVKLTPRAEAEDGKPAFTPAQEIYDRVDEQVVAEEKSAVRELVQAENAADLGKFVNMTMTQAVAGEWRYFRVLLTPRANLKTVPKDVVLLIDGSGSIGNDRLGSCRKAARRILRTCTNTGDRFNLVVFRNAFSYAFRTWRECDAPSFEAGDKWLARQTAHGRTDVFSTISSVLTLPRDPARPLIALVVTDGIANAGVSDTSEILSRFTALNDGLVSVYMYGVKSAANRELIDVLTHGNRGESFVFEGWRWNAGDGLEGLSERFRDPVLTDLRVIFSADARAEAYPRLLRNLYRGGTLSFVGRVPASAKDVAFSLRGLNGSDAYDGFFRLPFAAAPDDASTVTEWQAEAALDRRF
ncbi:MAG: VWA domain-containing protein [Kiritimatiellia bacterium]